MIDVVARAQIRQIDTMRCRTRHFPSESRLYSNHFIARMWQKLVHFLDWIEIDAKLPFCVELVNDETLFFAAYVLNVSIILKTISTSIMGLSVIRQTTVMCAVCACCACLCCLWQFRCVNRFIYVLVWSTRWHKFHIDFLLFELESFECRRPTLMFPALIPVPHLWTLKCLLLRSWTVDHMFAMCFSCRIILRGKCGMWFWSWLICSKLYYLFATLDSIGIRFRLIFCAIGSNNCSGRRCEFRIFA